MKTRQKKSRVIKDTNLHHDSVGQRCVRVDLPDLGVAVAEVELHDLLVDLVLPPDGVARAASGPAAAVDAAVDERGVVGVEAGGGREHS